MNAAPQTTRWAQYLAQAQALTPPASTGPARGPALTAAEAALSTPGPRPTAVICDDDQLAAGTYKAARRLGLRIPDDLSVTGVDDLALATAMDPELTTVHLNAELFGEHGMRALLAVLEDRAPESGDIPVQLIVRSSTAPPR